MSLPKFLLESRICNKDTCEIKRKLDQYEDPEDLTLFYMWLDVKTKDKMKQLQEENERLKEVNEEHRKLNGELRNGYCEIKEKCNKGECDCTNEEYESMTQANMKLRLLLDDYKTRNEKAIELIYKVMKERDITGNGTLNLNELLDILQGKSDE